MSIADATAAVARLVTAYGQENISEERVALYAEKLADIPPELLRATVDRVIESSRFFPAISELRVTAAGLAGLLPPTSAEALAIVRRADVRIPVYRRDGSLAYEDRQWDWKGIEDATVDAIRDTLERVGEPCDSQGENHFGWENGFQKTYETVAEPIRQAALADLSQACLPPHAQRALQSAVPQWEGVGGGAA